MAHLALFPHLTGGLSEDDAWPYLAADSPDHYGRHPFLLPDQHVGGRPARAAGPASIEAEQDRQHAAQHPGSAAGSGRGSGMVVLGVQEGGGGAGTWIRAGNAEKGFRANLPLTALYLSGNALNVLFGIFRPGPGAAPHPQPWLRRSRCSSSTTSTRILPRDEAAPPEVLARRRQLRDRPDLGQRRQAVPRPRQVDRSRRAHRRLSSAARSASRAPACKASSALCGPGPVRRRPGQ